MQLRTRPPAVASLTVRLWIVAVLGSSCGDNAHHGSIVRTPRNARVASTDPYHSKVRVERHPTYVVIDTSDQISGRTRQYLVLPPIGSPESESWSYKGDRGETGVTETRFSRCDQGRWVADTVGREDSVVVQLIVTGMQAPGRSTTRPIGHPVILLDEYARHAVSIADNDLHIRAPIGMTGFLIVPGHIPLRLHFDQTAESVQVVLQRAPYVEGQIAMDDTLEPGSVHVRTVVASTEHDLGVSRVGGGYFLIGPLNPGPAVISYERLDAEPITKHVFLGQCIHNIGTLVPRPAFQRTALLEFYGAPVTGLANAQLIVSQDGWSKSKWCASEAFSCEIELLHRAAHVLGNVRRLPHGEIRGMVLFEDGTSGCLPDIYLPPDHATERRIRVQLTSPGRLTVALSGNVPNVEVQLFAAPTVWRRSPKHLATRQHIPRGTAVVENLPAVDHDVWIATSEGVIVWETQVRLVSGQTVSITAECAELGVLTVVVSEAEENGVLSLLGSNHRFLFSRRTDQSIQGKMMFHLPIGEYVIRHVFGAQSTQTRICPVTVCRGDVCLRLSEQEWHSHHPHRGEH